MDKCKGANHLFLKQLIGDIPFDPNFDMNIGMANGISSTTCDSLMPEIPPTAFLNGSNTSGSLLLATQDMSGFSAYSTPSMTPELLDSPSSSLYSIPPSPVYDSIPPAWLTTPYPSLAGPSTDAYMNHMSYTMGFSSSLNLPIDSIFTSSATDLLSPIPSFNDGSCPKSRPRRKTRSSTAKSISACSKSSEPSEHLRVPCTVQGCSGLFFDLRTRNRHIESTHERAPGSGHYCPGMCRREGFSREDALNRHLATRDASSHCRIEAEKLGWSASARKSVQLLRKVTPSA